MTVKTGEHCLVRFFVVVVYVPWFRMSTKDAKSIKDTKIRLRME